MTKEYNRTSSREEILAMNRKDREQLRDKLCAVKPSIDPNTFEMFAVVDGVRYDIGPMVDTESH